MTYRYRCDRCDITSPDLPDRDAAEREQAAHRAQHHGQFDRIETAGPDRRHLDGRQLLISAGVVAALAALGWLRDHI